MPAIFTFAALFIGIIFFGKSAIPKTSVTPTPSPTIFENIQSTPTPTITLKPTVIVTITATPKPTVTHTPTPTPTRTPTRIVTPLQTKAPTPTSAWIPSPIPTTTPVVQTGGGYVCDCSKTCPNMSSCAEAQYQLNTCGCKVRDNDHDGIACDVDCQ